MEQKRSSGYFLSRDLSALQFDLLACLFIEGSEKGEIKPILWSPKRYLHRSPTRSEAPTLSKRVAALVKAGYLEKNGRYVKVTDKGVYALWVYVAHNREAESADLVLEFLVAEKNRRLGLALKVVSEEIKIRHKHRTLTDDHTFSKLCGILDDLEVHAWDRAESAEGRLDELLRQY